MKSLVTAALAAALLFATPIASRAALSTYSQNFETLVQTDPGALAADGWVVYGNVFTPAMGFLYGYGTFPAPNGTPGFCAIDFGQGGVPQGAQQLSIYNDYNNVGEHGAGNLVEANVFQEQTIALGDAGDTWVFAFDAKLGNLVSPSTAVAFIKTIDPNNGFAMTNFISLNTTAIPTTWTNYSLSIPIIPALAGQLLQFGFASTTTNFISSGVFYDNLSFDIQASTDVPNATRPRAFELQAAAPNPFPNSTQIAYSLADGGVADISVFDITGRRVATLFKGYATAGQNTATWNGRFSDGSLAPAGVYRCVLQTAAGRQSRNLVLTH